MSVYVCIYMSTYVYVYIHIHTQEKSKEKEDRLGKYVIPEYINSKLQELFSSFEILEIAAGWLYRGKNVLSRILKRPVDWSEL